MRKLPAYLLLAWVAWFYYQKSTAPQEIEVQPEPVVIDEPEPEFYQETELIRYAPTTDFSCDGRQYCSQMNSRPEAEYFLENCPDTKMDGDNDGIPCENDTRFEPPK